MSSAQQTRRMIIAVAVCLVVVIGLEAWNTARHRSATPAPGQARELAVQRGFLWGGGAIILALTVLLLRGHGATAATPDERYDYLVENVPAGVWRIDTEGNTTFVNPQMAKMLDLAPADVLGRSLFDFMAPHLVEDSKAKLEERKRGKSDQFDFALMSASGEIVHVVVTTHPLNGPDGQFLGAEAIILNVTERVNSERELSRSEARFRTMATASPQGIFLSDKEGQVVYANPRMQAIMGLDTAAICAGEWVACLHPDDRDEAVRSWLEGVKEGRSSRAEARVVRDGAPTAWLNCLTEPVYDEGELVGHVGMIHDVTDLMRVTEELREHRDNLETLVEHRTSDLRAYTYSVSHDMREPLRTIQGFAAAVLHDHADTLSEDGTFYVQRILAGAQRLDRMVVELGQYQRVSALDFQLKPEPLDRYVADALDDEVQEIADNLAEITVDPLPEVMGTGMLLRPIVNNLLANALKFHAPGEAPVVHIHAEVADGVCRLWVEDQGIGLAESDRERIFDLFARLHGQEAYDGIGIGLATVRRAAERLGGRAGVESTLGEGSRFWVDLPMPPRST